MDSSSELGKIQYPSWMTLNQKNVHLNVVGRRKDVQFGLFGKDHGDIYLTVTQRGGDKKPYQGPYTVTSVADGIQILETENKVMTENMVVMPIPYFETSNPKGGLTVYIGGD